MKVYESMTSANWHKGSRFNNDGTKACVMGHVELCYPRHESTWWKQNAGDELDKVARLLFPERISKDDEIGYLRAVAQVNDHPDTVLEDMIRICKLADV